MSYCKYSNTVLALRQILDSLDDISSKKELFDSASSDDERRAMKEFFSLVPEFAEILMDLSDSED